MNIFNRIIKKCFAKKLSSIHGPIEIKNIMGDKIAPKCRYDYFMDHLKRYQKSEVYKGISDKETMLDQWYFSVGKDAVRNIILACLNSNLTDVKRVLDIPCGHGRILRHLVKLFEGAEFTACDIDKEGVYFCNKTFNAAPLHSKFDLCQVDFNGLYDIIWVGSLFTHTSREITKKWIKYLSKYLSVNGIMIITLHGRWSRHVHKVAPYINDASWKKIIDECNSTGYGYAEYCSNENHPYMQGSYGISLTNPHTIIQDIEQIEGIRLFSYKERGWADHQDVMVIGRPSYDEPWH